jgi:hypothetical protein
MKRSIPAGDGTFNNIPIIYRKGAPSSAVHCVGDDGRPDAVSWMFRSCQFQQLCMNVETKEYLLVRDSKHPEWLPSQTDQQQNLTDYTVALGGINPRWEVGEGSAGDAHKVKWFPKIVDASEVLPSGYYELPTSSLLIPFHSFAAHNVGHLLWDDFYPIFNLMQLFGFVPGESQLTLIRQQLDPKQKLYASCDRPRKRKLCHTNFAKFLPLMGVDPITFSTSNGIRVAGALESPLVCAPTAAAGLGMLTDHGFRDHGWVEHNGTALEWVPHNLGRGPAFHQFRQFMVQNLLRNQQPPALLVPPRVGISIFSSRDHDRRQNFTQQIDYLQKYLPASDAHVESLTLWELSMEEQIQAAAQSQIFISTCGGGSMTATFLPRGASLIVFYNATGGFDFEPFELNGRAARLDWDLLNHVSHLRVHWLPITTMDSNEDLELLLRLVQHELTAMKSL